MSSPDFAVLVREITARTAAPEETDTDTQVLDATLYLVGEVGERRVTIDDVAERAHVARSTVFRRFGSKDALLQRLYEREVRKAVDVVLVAATESADVASAIVDIHVRLGDYVADHPVTKRQARVEPDVFVRLWREGEPSGMQMIGALLSEFVLRREDADGVDREALAGLSAALARLMFAELLLPDPDGHADRREREVRALVDSWLHTPTGPRRPERANPAPGSTTGDR